MSLGYLYRGYPSLMLKPGSTDILDAIFAAKDDRTVFQVLRIIQDFLQSQERTPAVQAGANVKSEQQSVKIDELVGNVEGFADSGCVSFPSTLYR